MPLTHGIEAAREVVAGATLGDVARPRRHRGADRRGLRGRRLRPLPLLRGAKAAAARRSRRTRGPTRANSPLTIRFVTTESRRLLSASWSTSNRQPDEGRAELLDQLLRYESLRPGFGPVVDQKDAVAHRETLALHPKDVSPTPIVGTGHFVAFAPGSIPSCFRMATKPRPTMCRDRDTRTQSPRLDPGDFRYTRTAERRGEGSNGFREQSSVRQRGPDVGVTADDRDALFELGPEPADRRRARRCLRTSRYDPRSTYVPSRPRRLRPARCLIQPSSANTRRCRSSALVDRIGRSSWPRSPAQRVHDAARESIRLTACVARAAYSSKPCSIALVDGDPSAPGSWARPAWTRIWTDRAGGAARRCPARERSSERGPASSDCQLATDVGSPTIDNSAPACSTSGARRSATLPSYAERRRDGMRLRACRASVDTAHASRSRRLVQASHHVSAVTVIVRGSTRSTPLRKRSLSGAPVCLNSTLISHGLPGFHGSTAFRSESACFAPASISSRARTGGICRADWTPRPFFTATVVSPAPSSSRPLRARGLVAGHEQHRAVPRPADRRMDPRLADERPVEPEVEVVLARRPCG